MKKFIEVTNYDGGMKVLVPIGKITSLTRSFSANLNNPPKNRITRYITTAGIISLRGAGVNVKPYRISTAAKI